MNIIKEFSVDPGKHLNYWCSWRAQSLVRKNQSYQRFRPNGSTRDSMCEEFLFGEVGVLEKTPREVRGELIAMIDDGWDVPFGAGQENCWNFGSLELDPERFPSFNGSPAERMKQFSARVKALGWYGLGLWCAVQIPTSDGRGYTLDEARAFWRERLSWCADADVKYLKFDWGRNCNDTEFRRMIFEEARKAAPEIIIEQANIRGCTDVRYADRRGEAYEHMKTRIGDLLQLGDVFRVYDVTHQFVHTTLIARAAEALEAASGNVSGCRAVVNVEDGVYVGAALGCSIGVMRCYPLEIDPANGYHSVIETPTNELVRALRFQRIAPPFAVSEGDYQISPEILHDAYMFPKVDQPTWPKFSDELVVQDCNAAIARGLPLPTAEHADYGEKPYILCAKNPRTGVSSVYAAPRTIGGSCTYSARADITVRGLDAAKPVGVFGHYRSLTLIFDDDLTGRRIFGQDLLSDEALDLTDAVTIDGQRLMITGELIDRIGRSTVECASERPGMVLLAK